MTDNSQTNTIALRDLSDVLKDVRLAVEKQRQSGNLSDQRIIDLRWKFDQISAKMNQAIYNNQPDQISASCLETVAVLIEMLSRR